MAEQWWEQQTPDPKLIESMAINYFSQSKEIWESFTDEQKERVRIRMRKIWDEVVLGLKVNQPSDVKPMVKLYTEEQVREAIKDAYLSGIERPIDFGIVNDSIIKSLTPIELPSDELIETEASYTYRLYPNNQKEHPEYKYNEDINAPRKRKAFIKGAKWLKDKILNNGK